MLTVILKNSQGDELSRRECQFANACESSHADMGTEKVEVLSESGEIVFDAFL